jgi:hypothetical protein
MHSFCWWMPLNVGPIRNAVLLPDSMVIFMGAAIVAMFVPYLVWANIWIYSVVVLLSPGFLLTLVLVRERDVFVFRLIAFIPYWRHRIPADAIFSLYEAWEDPAPSGVAFEAESYGANPLHLGTSRSARPLFSYIGSLLESAGWKSGPFRYEQPSSSTNTLQR